MYYLIFLLTMLITVSAEVFVNSKYKEYSKIKCKSGLSGFEVADKILKKNGIDDIYIVEVRGILTDHFDPDKRAVRLSSSNFHGETIASSAVSAHEVGHVIQHKEGNKLIKIRSVLVPFVNFSSRIGYLVIVISFIFGLVDLLYLGIGFLFVILLFELVTLPVEIDASKKALNNLKSEGLLEGDELEGARSVLTAAAFTYVASLATTILEIFRLFLMTDRD